jgi:hypothetical protein
MSSTIIIIINNSTLNNAGGDINNVTLERDSHHNDHVLPAHCWICHVTNIMAMAYMFMKRIFQYVTLFYFIFQAVNAILEVPFPGVWSCRWWEQYHACSMKRYYCEYLFYCS